MPQQWHNRTTTAVQLYYNCTTAALWLYYSRATTLQPFYNYITHALPLYYSCVATTPPSNPQPFSIRPSTGRVEQKPKSHWAGGLLGPLCTCNQYYHNIGIPKIYTTTGFGPRKSWKMAGVDDLVVYTQTAVKIQQFVYTPPRGRLAPPGWCI